VVTVLIYVVVAFFLRSTRFVATLAVGDDAMRRS